MKTRNWFLTINANAECWHKFEDIVKQQSRCDYAYIKHSIEKELSEDEHDNVEHYHLLLFFENARTFDTIMNTFKGAHIECMKYKNKSMRYLLHLDDKTKTQYNANDIVTSFKREVLMNYLLTDEYTHLTTEELLNDIESGECVSLTDFVRKYGLNQVSTKHNLITKLLEENRVISELKAKLFALELKCKQQEELLNDMCNFYGYHYDSVKGGISAKNE